MTANNTKDPTTRRSQRMIVKIRNTFVFLSLFSDEARRPNIPSQMSATGRMLKNETNQAIQIIDSNDPTIGQKLEAAMTRYCKTDNATKATGNILTTRANRSA